MVSVAIDMALIRRVALIGSARLVTTSVRLRAGLGALTLPRSKPLSLPPTTVVAWS